MESKAQEAGTDLEKTKGSGKEGPSVGVRVSANLEEGGRVSPWEWGWEEEGRLLTKGKGDGVKGSQRFPGECVWRQPLQRTSGTEENKEGASWFLCARTDTCTHMNTRVCSHTCTGTHTYNVHMHKHMSTHACTCAHMYTCVHTCVHIHMCTRVNEYSHMHVLSHTHAYTCVHVFTHSCTHCMHTRAHGAHIQAHTCVHMNTHTCTHICRHTQAHSHIYVFTCTHMCIHMHSHASHTFKHTNTYTQARTSISLRLCKHSLTSGLPPPSH